MPASLFRVYGGVLSDKYGARRIMYWTFGMSVVCCFVLSYPPTEYVVQGIRTNIPFHRAALQEESFIRGEYDTRFVERMHASETGTQRLRKAVEETP
mgnify:CR=1 FL=1